MNKENLRKLADYLVSVSEDSFDMSNYMTSRNTEEFFEMDSDLKKYVSNIIEGEEMPCNTVACAMGYAPLALGIGLEDDPSGDMGVWQYYALKHFDIYVSSYEFDWCFGSDWVDVDNTPLGAAKRIMHMVEHGLPSDSNRQMFGKTDYLFKN